jgi:hypothetical protein
VTRSAFFYLGVQTLFVLRNKAKESTGVAEYELIDEAYVHGMMDGEVIEGEVEAERLVLV